MMMIQNQRFSICIICNTLQMLSVDSTEVHVFTPQLQMLFNSLKNILHVKCKKVYKETAAQCSHDASGVL